MRSEAWRPAAAARNRSPREARDPALQALRPGCEELAVTDPAQMPVRQARPREPKTATVERREASVPRHGTQGASQAPGMPRHKRVHARLVTQDGTPHGCLARTRTSLGAPPTPRFGSAKQSCKPRAQTCAAGTRWAV